MFRIEFVEDELEKKRTLAALEEPRGPAWLEEIAFNYPVRFVIDGRDLFSREELVEVIPVDVAGRPAPKVTQADSTNLCVPLLFLVVSLPEALDNLSAGLHARLDLPGGGRVVFERSMNDERLVDVEVQPFNTSGSVPIRDLDRGTRELVEGAGEYLRRVLPAGYVSMIP